MTFQVDARELQMEAVWAASTVTRWTQGSAANVDKVARKLSGKIKQITPVDTGRARAGWAIYTPELLTRVDTTNPSVATDAIWIVEDEGMAITQGTNVPYFVYLNEGHSSQAPAGFVDVATEQAGDELEQVQTALVDTT